MTEGLQVPMASKVVIVTGASKGIGLAITQELLKNKHRVVLVSRGVGELAKVKERYPEQVEYLGVDLTEPDAASKVTGLALKAFGQIDGLVVNHGVLSPISRIETCSMDEFKKLYDVNVFSAVSIVQAAIAPLRQSKGCIVFTSSGAATKAYTAWGPYGMSKAALNAFAAHVAVEEPDITSISIAPGRVDTNMQKELREKGEGFMDPTVHGDFVDAYKKGDLLKPEQPGNVIARLVVDPNPSLSGKFLRWNAAELSAYQDA